MNDLNNKDNLGDQNQLSKPEGIKSNEQELIQSALNDLLNSNLEIYPRLVTQMTFIMSRITEKFSDPKTSPADKIKLHELATSVYRETTALSNSILKSGIYTTNQEGIQLKEPDNIESKALDENNRLTLERLKTLLKQVPEVIGFEGANNTNLAVEPSTLTEMPAEPTNPIDLNQTVIPTDVPNVDSPIAQVDQIGTQPTATLDQLPTQPNTIDIPTDGGLDAKNLKFIEDLNARIVALESMNIREDMTNALREILSELRQQDNETISEAVEVIAARLDNLTKSIENSSIEGMSKRIINASKNRLSKGIEKVSKLIPNKLNLNLKMPEIFNGVTKETLKKAMRNILIGAGAGATAMGTGAGLTALAMLNPPLFALLIGSTATIAGGAGVVGASTYAALNSYNWIRRQGASLTVGDVDKKLRSENSEYIELFSGLNTIRDYDSVEELQANGADLDKALDIFTRYINANPDYMSMLGTTSAKDAAQELIYMFFQDFKKSAVFSDKDGVTELYTRLIEDDRKLHKGLLMNSIRRERTEQEFRHQSFRETSRDTAEVLKMSADTTRKVLSNTASKVGKGFWANFKKVLNRKK